MNEAGWETIPELIDDAARRFGDREAMVDGDIRWNFSEFRAEIHTAARALMASGLTAGDRVALWAPNIWEWAVAALGVHAAGGVVVPINTRFKGREAAYVLQNSGAKMLFCVTDFLDTDYVALLQQAEVPETLAEIVVMRGDCPAGTTSFGDFMARATAVSEAERAARSKAITGDDLCHIMFTSGTTGDPKGAMLIHSAVCRSYLSWSQVIGLDRDRYLIINPFFHSFGLNAGILACLMTGSTIIPPPVFDVPSVMKRIPEERVSMLPGPPAIYQTILNTKDLDRWDMSSLRLAVTGAAAIPVEMIISMRKRLGFEKVVTGYGLTESSGIATMCRHDDDPEIIANTSGRAIDDVEVRIVDPEGQEVPRGEPGEIVVRGYNIMKGYLNDPAQDSRDNRRRRLAAHRRHRGDGRWRQHRHHRPGEGHVHQRRVQRLPSRDREPDDEPSRCRTSSSSRRARRAFGGSWFRLCGACGWFGSRRRRANRLVSRRDGQLQGPPTNRIRRRSPPKRQRQSPQIPTPRARQPAVNPMATPATLS